MKKGLKIAAIVVGVIIILMLLLPFAFQGKIAGIVKTEGNKMLNAQFDFKKLNISLFRNFPQASVTLEDFWLKGAGEFANDTLVQAGEVTATINLFSLFGDSGYDISKVFIEDTRLHAIVLPDGRANWDIMKPDTTDTQDTPAAALFHMHIIFGKKPVLGFVLSQRERFLILEFRHRHAIFNSDGHGTAAQEKIILTPSLPVSNVFAYLWNTVGKDRKLAAISGYATLLK